MHSSFRPPRQVKIGDAAAFAGSTPRAIRHYHEIGLLPEPERGTDDRRRYGYEDLIRLLWIRKMADAGIALDDIRDAFTTASPTTTAPTRATPTTAAPTGTAPITPTPTTPTLTTPTLTTAAVTTTPTGATPAGTASTGSSAGAGSSADADNSADTDSSADTGAGDDIAGILERVERTLAEREAELRRQRAAVQRMRTEGSRVGLLSDFVTARLKSLPEGSLRQGDLDSLLVTERIFGALGAAVHATRFIALARHPALRQESDRIDQAEEALDDSVAVDDPRVARVAAERHAFESALDTVIEESGLAKEDDALFEAWDTLHPAGDEAPGGRQMSAFEAAGKMPYDFSPARLRCMELALELSLLDSPGTRH
ncbi:MerR family transcriptional regulator [Pseudosporangium ferrugineum]|uniref:MerR family transcriptional regulator n=1 Tax=Pseudosporangium ferrugineum TaxID=439699 RepID=UPI001FE4F9C2|nr:MerR family transcriptional regulator [Pseudosporangium ferrugineum]